LQTLEVKKFAHLREQAPLAQSRSYGRYISLDAPRQYIAIIHTTKLAEATRKHIALATIAPEI
jgi:hypothetical protein